MKNVKKKDLAVIFFLVFGLAVLTLGSFLLLSKKKPAGKNVEKKQSKVTSAVLPEENFGDLKKIFSQNNYSSGAATLRADATTATMSAGQGGAVEKAMIYPPTPQFDQYDLVYVGGDFDLPSEKVEVLKRKKGRESEDAPFWKNILENFGQLANLNISSFEKLTVSNVSFYENKDYGLNFSLDLDNSSVYISAQWERWKNPYQICSGDQTCLEKNKLTKNDWNENDFLQLADDFLTKIGVDKNNYEKGFLDNKNYLILSKDNIPEIATVFYQQKINGKKVVDFSGNPDGLRVEIDVRQKKVRGVSPIDSLDFLSSSYPAENNRDRIIEIAENGGWKKYPTGGAMETAKTQTADAEDSSYRQPEYPFEEKKKKKEVQLGKPTLNWLKVWNYQEETGKNEELYIPSLVFPVIGQEEDFWPKNIIVPAVKEND